MSKKADSSPLEALEALIAEKRRQETFLAKLEERRAGTPEHVFNRLRDEYVTKLTDAQVRAAAAADTLSEGLAGDDAALADVETRLVSLEEERIELQLRAEIEGWDPKETQKKLAAMTAAIAMAEKERDARKVVAERARGLLAEARGDVPMPSATPSGSTSSAPPAGQPSTATMTGGPNFDELAFLNSVVGRASTPAMPAPASSTSVPADPPASNPEASAPSTSPVPPSPAPAPTAALPIAPPAAPASPQATLNLEPTAPGPLAAKPTLPTDAEGLGVGSGLGRPTPRTTQQVKTLKCAECGSMNYPTEWYCERCGGELAAL